MLNYLARLFAVQTTCDKTRLENKERMARDEEGRSCMLEPANRPKDHPPKD
jgi:hypothetical protein